MLIWRRGEFRKNKKTAFFPRLSRLRLTIINSRMTISSSSLPPPLKFCDYSYIFNFDVLFGPKKIEIHLFEFIFRRYQHNFYTIFGSPTIKLVTIRNCETACSPRGPFAANGRLVIRYDSIKALDKSCSKVFTSINGLFYLFHTFACLSLYSHIFSKHRPLPWNWRDFLAWARKRCKNRIWLWQS